MISLDELEVEQGEAAIAIELDHRSMNLEIVGYAVAKTEDKSFTLKGTHNAYINRAVYESGIEDEHREVIENFFLSEHKNINSKTDLETVSSYAKYKPVHLKTKPVYAELPDIYRIKREIKGDPLKDMPPLNPHPPEFKPKGRYTQERMEMIDKKHVMDLWPEERKLLHDVIANQNEAFAFDDSEGGRFRSDFFPPVFVPTIEHKPWVLKNIPIPPGLYDEICRIVKSKIDAGVYEPSNSSYRSRWFTVLKKDGKSLRIVHSLEPLNAVTIAHSGIPPATEEMAAHFAGRACGGIMDLFVGYDERLLDERSRDLTTFQTPYGAMRLVTLPMGWTNSVPIFHEDVTHILKDEIPEFAGSYIDDVGVRGPETLQWTPLTPPLGPLNVLC